MGGLCSRQKNRHVNDRNLRKKNLINTSHFGLCPDCNLPNTDKSQNDKYGWCRSCNSSRFEKGFTSWTSDNPAIDDFIKESQKDATNNRQILEWIPYNMLHDVQFVAKGGLDCSVYSATWLEGNILYWDSKKKNWVRRS